jgi:cysteinyl-tRNA synthetase
MLKILDVVPSWVYALALAALALLLGGEVYSHYKTRLVLERERTAFATERATALSAALEQSQRYRTIETKLKETQDANTQKAKALRDALDRLAGVADSFEPRLHDAAQAAAARARAQCAASATVPGLADSGDPVGVLADVFTRADKRAGVVAKVADARLVALQSCINEYNAGRDALKAADTGP